MSMSVPSDIPATAFKWAQSHPALTLMLAGTTALFAWYIVTFPLHEARLPFKNLRGPRARSLVLGHTREVVTSSPVDMHADWVQRYGPVFRYRGFMGRWTVYMHDTVALAYLTQHTYDFVKTPHTTRLLEEVLGVGVLTAEGAQHRTQRRVMNPAFGPAGVKTMLDVFYLKAEELARKLEGLVDGEEDVTAATPTAAIDKIEGTRKIDVLKYLGQMTLDVVGLAGFDYEFHALSDKRNELSVALWRTLNAPVKGIMRLVHFFPILGLLPTQRKKAVAQGRAATLRISTRIVNEKKQIVQEELQRGEKERTNDLLTRIVRNNLDPSLRDSDRMTEQEVVDQICTFIVAGHETTSTALTFCLYRLAQNPEVQARLREEVRAAGDNLSYDELQALPYLDNVVHESLRLDGPVPGGARRATKDAIFPLSAPVQGRDGRWMSEVHVSAGTDIFIPILSVNRSEEIWGPDAKEFNPDRFTHAGIPRKHVAGVYGNLLTFLGGARNCIGYRFAIAEMKATLFVLLKRLEFRFPPSNPTIKLRNGIVMRPYVAEEEDLGFQMPLLVSVVE